MKHNFIKPIIFNVLTLLTIACSSGLNKTYDASSKEEDYKKISEQISSEDLQILKDYIQKNEAENVDFGEMTYQNILETAKLLKEEEELWKAKMEKKKAAEEAIIQQKTELLCSKKWKIENIEYFVETSDDSVTVFQLTDAAIRIYSINGKRRKIYASDGTYKEIAGQEEIQKGTWKFDGPDKIQETRPPETRIRSGQHKNDVFILKINTLDEKQFSFTEKKSLYAYNPTPGTIKLITMVPHGK